MKVQPVHTLAMVLVLSGCTPAEEEPVDPGTPIDPLYVPDVADIDLPAAWTEGFLLSLEVRTAGAWAGHVAALGMRTEGCPDLWAGAPDESLEINEDAGGMSWADHCESGGGLDFAGALWWTSAVTTSGDAESAEGATTEASRALVGDALVGEREAARFELDGDAADALTLTVAPDYRSYTWSSLLSGTVTGSTLFEGTATPGGYRADQYLHVEDGARLESRGNLYLFEDRIAERFDSVAMDLTLVSAEAAGPADCTLEPYGWVSLRDANAYWYDLVFLPAEGDTVDTELPAGCDGCGTLYIRGVEYGEVCPDLSAAWDGRLEPPDVADYVLSIHDLP